MSQAPNNEIIIVDDDPAVRDALSVVLTLEGYHVTGYGDGQSLLNAARNRVPSCIFLDVHMPGRSGLDILKELNAQDYDAPIFIISGQGDIPMAVDAIKNGALDFIEKPFDADTVVSRVREAIEAWGRRKESGKSSDLMSSFPGARRSRRVNARFSPRSPPAHRTRKPDATSASVHALSRFIAPASWRSSGKNAADLVRIVMSERH